MSNSLLIGVSPEGKEIQLLLSMANRHGLIAGATGTGKTATLQVLAESFSKAGVPVFLPDIKGDLAGLSAPALMTRAIEERIAKTQYKAFSPQSNPVVFWDLKGTHGYQVRTTVSEMGPLLLARLLNLNETQTGILSLTFRLADKEGLLLLDLKDVDAVLTYISEHTSELRQEYGVISSSSLGTIKRKLHEFIDQTGTNLFGEPALALEDLIRKNPEGKGIINILDATEVVQNGRAYASFLLWLLSELFEELPEVGEVEKPKLVFFFDEAHLLFDDAPKELTEKVEAVVRLIRSKGVGVYFITQNPLDIPDNILRQLGNKIQHALRAFTAKETKAVKAVASSFRDNPDLNETTLLQELPIGEALISCLDEQGRPEPVMHSIILPPSSKLGPISDDERKQLLLSSPLKEKYSRLIDRDSAYEKLSQRSTEEKEEEVPQEKSSFFSSLFGSMTKSMVKSIGTQIAREVTRGILGSMKRR